MDWGKGYDRLWPPPLPAHAPPAPRRRAREPLPPLHPTPGRHAPAGHRRGHGAGIKPDTLNHYGIALDEGAAAIRNANALRPLGQVDDARPVWIWAFRRWGPYKASGRELHGVRLWRGGAGSARKTRVKLSSVKQEVSNKSV